jgi:hypothetical protein
MPLVINTMAENQVVGVNLSLHPLHWQSCLFMLVKVKV